MVDLEVYLIIAFQAVLILAVLLVFAARYKKVPPDKAMIVFGRRMNRSEELQFREISGGGKFILPVIEDREYLDLKLRRTVLEVDNVRTDPVHGSVPVRCTILVLYKISSERSALRNAATHIMGKTDGELKRIVDAMVEGTVHEVASTMIPRAMDISRVEVAGKIEVQAQRDLFELGIELRSLNIMRVIHKGVDRVG